MPLSRRQFLKLGAFSMLDLALPFSGTKTHARNNKRMILEVHDISPRFYEEGNIQKIDKKLDEMEAYFREYFIIPMEEYTTDNSSVTRIDPISRHPEFLEYIKENHLGYYPIGQHGLHHWPMNQEGFEYSLLNGKETEEKNELGREEILDSLKVNPDRFAFPNWKYSEEAFNKTIDMYDEVFDRFDIYLNKGDEFIEKHRGNAYTLTWEPEPVSERKKLVDRIFSENPSLFRLVIHPHDTRSDAFDDILYYIINRAREEKYIETFSHDL
ncbi:MAG: DUF2334 domain-containing protein [Candidatus Aenigmatarchaeota archaeon]